MLRIFGSSWSPDEAVQIFAEEPDLIWHAGEQSFRGKPHADSGVSYCIGDAASVAELIADIRSFVERNGESLASFIADGLQVEIDIGVTVGDSRQFTVAVPFDSADLRLIGGIGIDLVFSAYPTSDDANADDESAV